MKKNILGFFNTPHKLILAKNFSSLVIVQIANNLLPLIVLPYLVRVIGVEKFGTIAIAQALAIFFVVLTTFGFNLYGPKKISVVREDKDKLITIFWNIMYARVFICLIGVFIYGLLIYFIPKFRSELWLFIFAFGFVIGELLFPVWFFQGIEKMTYIAGFNFFIKILYTISIFVFIKEKQHYIFVPLFYSLSQIIVGALALGIVIFYFKLFPIIPKLNMIYSVLKKSFILFVSSSSITIYTKINPIILGFICGDIYVGYYSAAEKLFHAWMRIQNQLGLTLYPHISKMALEKSKKETLTFIKKALLLTLSLSGFATLGAFVFAKPIIIIVFGKNFVGSIYVLRILSFVFIINGISNILGTQTMLPFNMYKQFLAPTITAVFIGLVFSFILIPHYQHIGAAVAFLFYELWIAGIMFFLLKRKGFVLFPDLSYLKKIWKQIR